MKTRKIAVVLTAIFFTFLPILAQASSDQVQEHLDRGDVYSPPLRGKGLVVHFGPKKVVGGISGRFMYSVGLNGEKKSVDLPEDLIEVFLKQEKVVQENGIWVVVTNPDAYSAEEKEMINTLGKLCKQKNLIFFKARGMDLPGGWMRIN